MIPWKNQPVRPFVRILAWVFVIITLLTYLAIIVLIANDVIKGNTLLSDLSFVNSGFLGFFKAIFFLVGPIYFCVLFGHVAIKGRAPSTWLPWR